MDLLSEGVDETAQCRRDVEWFTSSIAESVYVTTIGGSAERLVKLYFELALHVSPLVDLAIVSFRNNAAWRGDAVATTDVVAALERARWLLAAHGGVEVTAYTEADQLSLTPELGIVIYARSERWAELLVTLGLAQRQEPRLAGWTPRRQTLREVGELTEILTTVVTRLNLRRVSLLEDALP